MEEEKDIIEGFNAGYILERFKPELAQKVSKNFEQSELPYAEGFVAGSKEAVLEKEKSRGKLFGKLDKRLGRGQRGIDKGIDQEK